MIRIENLKMISEDEVLIMNRCPSCDKLQTLIISVNQYWDLVQRDRKSIQSILSDKLPWEREILLSGLCHDCWIEMFNEGDEE